MAQLNSINHLHETIKRHYKNSIQLLVFVTDTNLVYRIFGLNLVYSL